MALLYTAGAWGGVTDGHTESSAAQPTAARGLNLPFSVAMGSATSPPPTPMYVIMYLVCHNVECGRRDTGAEPCRTPFARARAGQATFESPIIPPCKPRKSNREIRGMPRKLVAGEVCGPSLRILGICGRGSSRFFGCGSLCSVGNCGAEYRSLRVYSVVLHVNAEAILLDHVMAQQS